jgi:hypothetical protein
MSLEDKIDAMVAALKENTAALKASRAVPGAPVVDGETVSAPAAMPRGRGRPSKPVAAAPAPVEELVEPPAEELDEEPAVIEEPEVPALTTEEVKDIAMKVMNVLGQADAKKLIKRHGADKLVDLPAENFAAFHAEATKMLEDAGDDTI